MEGVGVSRAADQIEILAMVEEWLPDFVATFTAHDGPNQFIDHEMRTQLVDRGAGEERESSHRTFLPGGLADVFYVVISPLGR